MSEQKKVRPYKSGPLTPDMLYELELSSRSPVEFLNIRPAVVAEFVRAYRAQVREEEAWEQLEKREASAVLMPPSANIERLWQVVVSRDDQTRITIGAPSRLAALEDAVQWQRS